MKYRILFLLLALFVSACSVQLDAQPVASPEPGDSGATVQPLQPKATSAPTETPSLSGKTVFSSFRGEDPEIINLHMLDLESGEITEMFSEGYSIYP